MTKNFRIFVIFILLYLPLAACVHSLTKNSNCGKVISKHYYYDSIENRYKTSEFYSSDIKMWFKDSTVIVKTMGLNIETYTNGHTTTEVKLAYYTYLDLKQKSFYQYSSFSDTATIMNNFSLYTAKNLQVESVMWSFYDLPIKKSDENLKMLSDTVIEGIKYKRKSFVNSFKGNNDSIFKNTVVGYYRCDKNGTLFRYGDNYSGEEPCSLVRVEYLPLPPLLPSWKSLMEVEFVSDSLTPEELKVFSAWEKNAKNNPIK